LARQVLARFFERGVGRGSDEELQLGAGLITDPRRRAPAAGQLVGRAALSVTADEVAHGGGADAEQLSDLAL
jgi:hypothetical protein